MAESLSTAPPPEAAPRMRLHVRALAAGGAGVADMEDGRVVFVPRSAPGDVVEARLVQERKRWAKAHLESVVQPGPGRVEPPCPRYATCGGCSIQHVSYDEQLAWKGRFVADALTRIGGLEVEPPTVVPSPLELGYRNRVTFTLRRLTPDRVVAGYHALDRPGRIVDVVGECLLPEPAIGEAWTELRGSWGPGARRLPQGKELRITVRATGGAVGILVRGGREGWKGENLLRDLPGTTALWHQPSGAEAPQRVAGPPTLEQWGEDRFPLGGGAFVQVNRQASEPLVAWVMDAVGTVTSAVDAYCGVGIYGRAFARSGARVVGIELDAEACAAARHEAPDGFQVVEGRVEDHLSDALPAAVIVLNPPRTGLAERVPEILVETRSPRVIYVSCDPATLARDAARLAPAYELVGLRAFDLFPQTAHVESVAVFEER